MYASGGVREICRCWGQFNSLLSYREKIYTKFEVSGDGGFFNCRFSLVFVGFVKLCFAVVVVCVCVFHNIACIV